MSHEQQKKPNKVILRAWIEPKEVDAKKEHAEPKKKVRVRKRKGQDN